MSGGRAWPVGILWRSGRGRSPLGGGAELLKAERDFRLLLEVERCDLELRGATGRGRRTTYEASREEQPVLADGGVQSPHWLERSLVFS